MGLLEKIFGKKKEEQKEPEVIVLHFREIDSWYASKTSGFLDSISIGSKKSLEKIDAFQKQLKKDIEILEKSDAKDTPDTQDKKAALDNKTAFVRKVQAFNSKIILPDTKDAHRTLVFYDGLLARSNKLIMETPKNLYFAKILFNEEIKKITDILQDIIYTAEESRKTIYEKKDRLKLISDTSALISEAKIMQNALAAESKNLEESKEKLKKMIDRKKTTVKRLKELRESNEAKNLKKSEELLSQQKKQLLEIKDNIRQIFSPLAKPLKKYERYSIGLDKTEIKILENYINSPFDAVMADTKFLALDKILENTIMLINSNRIILKDKEKSLAQINELKGHLELEKQLEDYMKTRKSVENLEKEVEGKKIGRDIIESEKMLSNTESAIDNQTQDIKNMEDNLENIKKESPIKIKKLESYLKELSGSEVSIKIES